jgi:excinuclease ABC subunit C
LAESFPKLAEDFDLKSFIKNLTTGPGVYRMMGDADRILYVGKARNLQRRVGSYFLRTQQTPKTDRLLSFVERVEVTLTHTETEALILENNLIKKHKPPYNIMLRDDKGYPFIFISTAQEHPRISFHRGPQRAKGRYFGPYPSAGSAREAMNHIQRLFSIRTCEDSFYKNRSRPCLQYQIKRCSGPCVDAPEASSYKTDIGNALLFLEGKNHSITESLTTHMIQAAADMEYEKAAKYRDQVAALRSVEETQHVDSDGGDSDVIVCQQSNGMWCVAVWFVRAGRQLGHKALFPSADSDTSHEELLGEFMTRYYSDKPIPAEIIVAQGVADQDLLEDLFSQQAERRVHIRSNVRGKRARWLDMAALSVAQALTHRLASDATTRKRFVDLQMRLDLEVIPERIECFDISHSMGEATVASCVVFDVNGAKKTDYRRFNINGITPGDDYAAMKQAIERRYSRVKEEGGLLPDVLLIDGGKGQLSMALEVLQELGIVDMTTIGVAKGTTRKPGLEQLFLSPDEPPLILPNASPALHLIQQVRDEAHRFAITGHRGRRDKKRITSTLEDVPGLGPKRRQRLLTHFGGLQQLRRSGVDELIKVQGISRELAQKIVDHFQAS